MAYLISCNYYLVVAIVYCGLMIQSSDCLVVWLLLLIELEKMT